MDSLLRQVAEHLLNLLSNNVRLPKTAGMTVKEYINMTATESARANGRHQAGPADIWGAIAASCSQGKTEYAISSKARIMALAKETADEPLALLAKIRGIQQEVTKHNTVYEPIISKEELTMYVATCINSCRKSPNDSLKIILREITEIRGGVYVYPPVEQVAAHLVDFIQKSAPQESTPVGIGSKIHSLTNAVSRADNTRYVNTLPEKKSFCEYLLRGKQCQNYPDCEGKHADFCMAHLDGKCLQGEQCELVHIDAGTGCGRRATKSAVSQVPGRFQRAERDRQERWARPTAMKETPCPRLVTAGTCRFDAAKCWYSHEYCLVQAAVCERKQDGVISAENKEAATDTRSERFVEPSGKGGRGNGKGKGKGAKGGKGGRGEDADGRSVRSHGGQSSPATEVRTRTVTNVPVEQLQTTEVVAAQVVVTAQVEEEEFDPWENFVGSTYMSDEAKELSNDSEFRGKHGITALVLDTAAATSIMSGGVLQDQKRLRKSVKVSPYAGEPIVIDKEGVFLGIDNRGFMLHVPEVLAMQGDCLNLVSWSQLSRLGYELRGEGNELSLFDNSQKCCGQFLRCESARGRKYRGLFVLNMAMVPLTSGMGQDPWVKQRTTQWDNCKAKRSHAGEGQRVWANVVRCGVENESKLEADVSSVSEEIGDEALSLDECEQRGRHNGATERVEFARRR